MVPSAGTVNGSTVHGEQANTGSCERSDAREMVYELDVPQRERVTIDLEARFRSASAQDSGNTLRSSNSHH